MSRKICFAAASSVMILLAICIEGRGAAARHDDEVADVALRHPTPWPIWHWRHHQPRRGDITPEKSRSIDQLYMRIEKKNPELIAPDFRPK